MYSRFRSLEGMGAEQMENLRQSTALVIGLGSTGSMIANHLARHGIELLVVDRDFLEPNDCYSSDLYTMTQCRENQPKAKAAESMLGQFTEVEARIESVRSPDDIPATRADIIMDGTDNIEARRIINSASKKFGVPWIYTAAVGRKGYSAGFDENCFECILGKADPSSLDTCESAGIMRETSSLAASRSSLKAVEYLSGKDELDGRLEDVRSRRAMKIETDGCEVCEGNRTVTADERAISTCGERKYEIRREIDPGMIENLRESSESYEENKYLLRASTPGGMITVFKSGRAIVEAEDTDHAEQVFSEALGL